MACGLVTCDVVSPRYLRYLEKQIDKAYDRAHFLNERKILMQEWADYLDEISNSRATV